MMAKNKHIFSSRDSNRGRSNSVRECSRWPCVLEAGPPAHLGCVTAGQGRRCGSGPWPSALLPGGLSPDGASHHPVMTLSSGLGGTPLTHSACHCLLLLPPTPWKQQQMQLIPERLLVAVNEAKPKL